MAFHCYVCNRKLVSETTQVCSNTTHHNNVPLAEKISEIVGEDYVVIVTAGDHLCRRCTSLLNYLDKVESDLKVIRSVILKSVQKKYGILSPNELIPSVEIVNGDLKIDETPPTVPKKPVPNKASTSTVRENRIKLSPKTIKDTGSKIYKCGFCDFQSKELSDVRAHLNTHSKEKKNEMSSKNATPKAPSLAPQMQKKKQIYKCQVCSKIFENKETCLDHINKNHNNTENKANETEVTSTTTSQAGTSDKTQKNMSTAVGKQKVVNGIKDMAKKTTAKRNPKQKSTFKRKAIPPQENCVQENTVQENAIQENAVQENAVQENAVQENAVQENAVQENAIQENTETTENASASVVMANENESHNGNMDLETMLAAIHHDENFSTDHGN